MKLIIGLLIAALIFLAARRWVFVRERARETRSEAVRLALERHVAFHSARAGRQAPCAYGA
jgi:hypothetical protein